MPQTNADDQSPSMLVSLNPYDQSVVGEVLVTPTSAIPGVVARARKAQPAWGELSLDARRDALRPLGERIQARHEEFAGLITREMGKTIKEARSETAATAGRLAQELDAIVAALSPEQLDDGSTRSTIHYDPLGVCACITPWNFPLKMPHWLVIPALMAGNAVVLKPS